MYNKEIYLLILTLINENKKVNFRIHGTSMKPLLKDNSKVILGKIDKLNINDIIFYRRNDNEYILHRLIKIDNDKLTFIGDHQIITETINNQDNCVAKAYGYYKKNKLKEFKGLKYKIYLFSLKFKFIRRLYAKF